MAQPLPARIGDPVHQIDTPALILELDAFGANIELMAAAAARMGVALRPHAKSNKCADIARRQLAAGAVGVCVQKVSEAVALADAGIDDITICNELVGEPKIAALVELSRRIRVSACVDDIGNIAAIERQAAAASTTVSLMVEVDVGQGRCGVPPGPQVVRLAQAIGASPHLKFAGLQAYHGGAQHIRGVGERRAAALSAIASATAARDALAAVGIACPVISGAGTGTFRHEGASKVYTEIQPGSYVFMDADYNRNHWEAAPSPEVDGDAAAAEHARAGQAEAPPFRQSLFVMTTVMSCTDTARPVVDAGLKALAVDSGMPVVADRPDIVFERASDEHGSLRVPPGAPALALGDRLRLVPGHCDPTVNLYDWLVAVRGGRVEAIWPVTARGCVN